MNGKAILKWGLIALAVYIAWNWLSGVIADAQYNPGDSGLFSPTWAAPLVYQGPVTGWYAPWQRRPRRIRTGAL